MAALTLATYNVNGIRARLSILLQWLERERPDIVCLQELKAKSADFPQAELQAAGYGALWDGQPSWNGVAILARDDQPLEIRRGLPGMEDDPQRRYLEAAVQGVVVACLYLPNGNPWPGPKFDYKLPGSNASSSTPKACWRAAIRWCWRVTTTWYPPTVTSMIPNPGARMPCCNPRVVPVSSACSTKAGWMPCVRGTRMRRSTPIGTTFGNVGNAMRVCASTICY